jgi:phage shock protein E
MLKNFSDLATGSKLLFIGRKIAPVFTGAFAGYLYYSFIGCRTGTCAITSNPYISTIYGAGVGLLFINLKWNAKKE